MRAADEKYSQYLQIFTNLQNYGAKTKPSESRTRTKFSLLSVPEDAACGGYMIQRQISLIASRDCWPTGKRR